MHQQSQSARQQTSCWVCFVIRRSVLTSWWIVWISKPCSLVGVLMQITKARHLVKKPKLPVDPLHHRLGRIPKQVSPKTGGLHPQQVWVDLLPLEGNDLRNQTSLPMQTKRRVQKMQDRVLQRVDVQIPPQAWEAELSEEEGPLCLVPWASPQVK